jgi:hypothetical protein
VDVGRAEEFGRTLILNAPDLSVVKEFAVTGRPVGCTFVGQDVVAVVDAVGAISSFDIATGELLTESIQVPRCLGADFRDAKGLLPAVAASLQRGGAIV